jgi:integrator complex subunit 11
MFDCGMHMAYHDERKFPNFKSIQPNAADLTKVVDAVFISHFHLDHCGALPYLTEVLGYRGPVVMTAPTKAIAPVLLEDFRKIVVDKHGEAQFPFKLDDVKACMNRVTTITIGQTLTVAPGITVKCHYAGHVLGASMFEVHIDGKSIIYTGDYNTTPDKHLGGAFLDRDSHDPVDLIITESTYATTIRDSKRAREQELLRRVRRCIDEGGKVLIPVFALGRAQELCILLNDYWDRTGLKAPMYFSAGMTQKANEFYKIFLSWTNEDIKRTFQMEQKNKFDFEHILPFEKAHTYAAGPMVVFASPGMLHTGTSLEIFKEWAGDARNLLVGGCNIVFFLSHLRAAATHVSTNYLTFLSCTFRPSTSITTSPTSPTPLASPLCRCCRATAWPAPWATRCWRGRSSSLWTTARACTCGARSCTSRSARTRTPTASCR